MTLFEGNPNQSYKVCAIHTQDMALKNRLFSMGISKDAKITIDCFTPNKATLAVQVNQTKIALRNTEAQNIIVEAI
ncbi:hypothetical protein BBW65_02585 [Helicobacter enhydrae]|uniref:Ferrous iron transporter FeoA-like domain-containing protein n=1 Tax=Helicobacter enhydrae TaxID=222136 RepID=A0A1B1U4Y7_9HELI|nr:FeoA family protein [Helicobacter enhydrae]ANV97755.1 hypothetical protein BBW65_02585 [Helicobacter enhydrae]